MMDIEFRFHAIEQERRREARAMRLASEVRRLKAIDERTAVDAGNRETATADVKRAVPARSG